MVDVQNSTCSGNSLGVGGGVILVVKKLEIPGRRGGLREIPSVVGVWIFSGTTQLQQAVNWIVRILNKSTLVVT